MTEPVMRRKEDCGVCGASLVYTDEAVSKSCTFCGSSHPAQIYCPNGHYVCDTCHRKDAISISLDMLSHADDTDPIELIERIITHPSVSMHGPEHHAIVPAAIVAAARNSGYPIPLRAVEAALRRGEKVPGGWCGFYRACGAGIGVGIAVSILTRATPLTGDTRKLCLEATSEALAAIADEHPRCCKRASRKAIESAIGFLDLKLGIKLKAGAGDVCHFSRRNKECPLDGCEYYTEGIGS